MTETTNIHARVSVLENTTNLHHTRIAQLEDDIGEIKTTLGKTATSDDILKLSQKIDASINGLLRDALQSVPQRAMVWLTAVLALIALASLAFSHLHLL